MRTGVDIVNNSRIKSLMDKYEDRFFKKIFTPIEIDYILYRKNDFKTVAGLFAGKEAISKMIGRGIGKLSWQDIEIDHDQFGRPFLVINPKINSYLKDLGILQVDISISHEEEFSIAFAIGI